MNPKKLTKIFQSGNVFVDPKQKWITNGRMAAKVEFLTLEAQAVLKSKNEEAVRAFFRVSESEDVSFELGISETVLDACIKESKSIHNRLPWVYQDQQKNLFSVFANSDGDLAYFPREPIMALEIDTLLGPASVLPNPYCTINKSFILMPVDLTWVEFVWKLTKA